MDKVIMVSIDCTVYNHEKYIAETLESFLMQKTSFKYEILIHDDASTDKTADIIKKYEKKYPDLIKPIYQSENQYSKGVSVDDINIERAMGKYIALCEGDDFWTDPNKLQKQVEYMEEHPECSMCTHAAYVIDVVTKKRKYIRPNIGNKIYTTEEVIAGGGGLFATNSIMYLKSKDVDRLAFYKMSPASDYSLVINLALKGTVYYADKFMSAYRRGVDGSWTTREMSSIEKIIRHFYQIEQMLDELNKNTDYKYNASITSAKNRNQFYVMLEKRDYEELKKGEYKEIYNSLGLKKRIKIYILNHFQNCLKILKKIGSS